MPPQWHEQTSACHTSVAPQSHEEEINTENQTYERQNHAIAKYEAENSKIAPFVAVTVSWVFLLVDGWINGWSLCGGVWVYEMSDSYYSKRTAGIIDMKPTIRHYNDKTGQISMKSMNNPKWTNQSGHIDWFVGVWQSCGFEKSKMLGLKMNLDAAKCVTLEQFGNVETLCRDAYSLVILYRPASLQDPGL